MAVRITGKDAFFRLSGEVVALDRREHAKERAVGDGETEVLRNAAEVASSEVPKAQILANLVQLLPAQPEWAATAIWIERRGRLGGHLECFGHCWRRAPAYAERSWTTCLASPRTGAGCEPRRRSLEAEAEFYMRTAPTFHRRFWSHSVAGGGGLLTVVRTTSVEGGG